jgi:hypothetical protein
LFDEGEGGYEGDEVPALTRSQHGSGAVGRGKESMPAWLLPVGIGGGVVVVLLIVVIVLLVNRGPSPPATTHATPPSAAATPGGSNVPQAKSADAGKPATVVPAAVSPSKAKVVARAGSGPVTWSVEADPAPAPAQPAAAAPIPLTANAHSIRSVVYTKSDKGQAAILTGTKLSELRIERYDLANGASLGSLADLFSSNDGVYSSLPSAISPDGSQFALRDPKEDSRLHVRGLADGKQIANWVPYSSEKKKGLAWVAMPAANRVMSLNDEDKAATLVLWQLPECTPIYSIENVSAGYMNRAQAAALSPGGKYLAAFNGQSYDLFDVASGERRGQTERVPSQAIAACAAVAFRPDGEELAAVLAVSKTKRTSMLVVRWDMKTGSIVSQFPLALQSWSIMRNSPGLRMANMKAWMATAPLATSLVWSGPKHLLINSSWLADLDRQQIVWHYTSSHYASAAPDGSCWVVSGATQQHFMHVRLPSEATTRAIEAADDAQAAALIRPGGTVSLKLEFDGPPTDGADYKQKLAELLTAQLEGYGLTVQDGQPATLLVKV